MSGKEPIRISIVMAVKNAHNTVKKAIDSILAQQYPGLEFIVVDGKSTDGTLDILNEHQQAFDVFISASDRGAAHALNTGIEKATGDYIGFLFADDWQMPHTLERIAALIQEKDFPDIASCGCAIVRDRPGGQHDLLELHTSEQALAISLENLFVNRPLIGCRFFKQEIFTHLKGFVAEDQGGHYNYANDTEFLLRTLFEGYSHACIPSLGYVYRSHQASATFAQDYSTIRRCLSEEVLMAKAHLKKANLPKATRRSFESWHQERLARLFFYSLLNRKPKNAWRAAWQAFVFHPGLFLWEFMTFPFNVLAKRIRRAFTGKAPQAKLSALPK